jgi:hypothetical protein
MSTEAEAGGEKVEPRRFMMEDLGGNDMQRYQRYMILITLIEGNIMKDVHVGLFYFSNDHVLLFDCVATVLFIANCKINTVFAYNTQ